MYRFLMALGDRMRAARTAANLSQTELAARIGVSRAAVSQFEAGKATPRLDTLIAFAAETGASLDFVVMGKQPTDIQSRVESLPEALREYVLHSLALAERVRAKLPERFIVSPTSATYQAFHAYLTELSESVKNGNTATRK